jgi:hypothetical protein
VRRAGVKVVLRFAYSSDTGGADASPSQVLSHLDQLAPYLSKNEDVIAVLQAGFIGGWGEWAYSQHFGDTNSLTSQNWSDRKMVADKLLQVLPADRSVQLRNPKYKQTLYSSSPLTSSEAFTGTATSRLGHHNDCFLAASDDWTYTNVATDYPYLASDTAYVPMGGETCNYNPPRSDCPTALSEMAQFHWSYINSGYIQSVLDSWKTQGCYTQMMQKLGYRFVLQSGSYSSSAKPGGAFTVNLSLQNQGWSAPFNSRKVELVLRNTATGALTQIGLTADPRTWLPGQTITLNQTVTLPAGMASGNYAVLLNLPDPMPSLQGRPEYAIQLANNNMWEASTGLNNLKHNVVIAVQE